VTTFNGGLKIIKNDNVLKLIADKISYLPASQKRLGEYLLAHYREAANLSALDLGEKAGVSDATVVRFSKAIGLTGYSEIKRELFKCLASEESPSEKIIKSLSQVNKVTSGVAEVFQNDINNIQETFKSFSMETLTSAVNAINEARRVYILGLNSCESLAKFLNFHLRRLHLDVHLITSGGLVLLEQLIPIASEDILIVISFPRYSLDTLSGVELAVTKGSQIICITDKAHSPIAKASNFALIAHSTSPGFYNSYAAATTICNALVLSFALLDEKRSINALKKT
jgi:DNA-binding MurR/RpiR family transcriptional regulator